MIVEILLKIFQKSRESSFCVEIFVLYLRCKNINTSLNPLSDSLAHWLTGKRKISKPHVSSYEMNPSQKAGICKKCDAQSDQ